jgi:cellulose synthase operon protein C
MSGESSATKDQEAFQQEAEAVMRQLRAGQAPKDVVRDLEADGWSKDDAVTFVGKVEQLWRTVDAPGDTWTASEIEARFPHMRPMGFMPWMFRLNGCGVALYGARDQDAQTGTYIKTHAISLIFFPVFALGAYRVAKADGGEGWHLIGKEPLSAFVRTWNMLVVAAVLGWIAHVIW